MRIPLGIKISLGTFSVVLITLSFLLVNTYNYLVINDLENLKQEVHINTSRLQQTIEFLLKIKELEQVQVELSSLGSIKHMNHAFLVDEKNEIIASSQLAYIGKKASDKFYEHEGFSKSTDVSVNYSVQKTKLWVSDDGNTLFASYPVLLGLKDGERLIENKMGYIGAHIDLRWISTDAFKTLLIEITPVVLLLLVMVVLVAIFYNSILVNRIKKINNAAKKFTSSGYKERVLVTGNDEISDLGSAFNTMAEKVEAQSKELIESKERVALIIDSVEDSIITINEKGLIRSFSKSAEKMFGYLGSEIIGENISRLMPDPYKSIHDDVLNTYMKTGENHIIGIGRDLPALHKDGHVFSIHLSVNELPEQSGKERLFIGSCRDITILKEQEQQLRQSQKMDALGKLTGGIAHDYNNMLGVILGYSELLTDKLSTDPKLQKYVTEIHAAGQRGAKLTEKLLAFSRQKTMSPDVTNINMLLENIRNMLEKTLTARIQLSYALADDIWPVYLDKGDLEDAILNMCINSMHAIEHSGHMTFSTENCRISTVKAEKLKLASGSGDYVCLSVQDTGCGIDENALMRIFDPFFTTKGDHGNGLGLSQVYGFVNRSMGAIKVESRKGFGSCFKLYFPRYTGNEIGKDPILHNKDICGGNETILVVDDEISLRALLSETLTACGYNVVVADSAEQAIELLSKQAIDLVLSDVIMPGMNGYKLAEYVAAHYPQVKIQLASGYSDNSHNSEQQAIHNNILNKPFEREALLIRLRNLLDDTSQQHKVDERDLAHSLTGISSVDEDHSTIVSMANECIAALDIVAGNEQLNHLIDKLLNFTELHFSREELLLEKCGHNNIKQCKSTHEFLLKALKNAHNQYEMSQMSASDFKQFFTEWVHDHINDLDTNMLKPLLKSDNDVVKLALYELDESSKR